MPAFKVGLADKDSAIRLQTVRIVGAYAKEEPEIVVMLGAMAKKEVNADVRLAIVQELGSRPGHGPAVSGAT